MKTEAPLGSPSALERARRYVQRCPPAISGQGGHPATFRVACALVHGFSLGEAEALNVLREWNASCQPPWSEAELRHKITSALAAPSNKAPGYLLAAHGPGKAKALPPGAAVLARLASGPTAAPAKPHKVEFEPETLQRVAARMPNVDDAFVKERSPLCPETQTPASFLQQLYKKGERILVFNVYESQGLHLCECVEPPYDAGCLDHLIHGCKNGVWYMCNPVDGKYHPNPRFNGKLSRRSEESVTSWRYLVLESDEADPRQWLAMLVQLPLRIAAIYGSGGSSIHALVQIDATSKADWDAKARKLKPLMTILGADHKTITAVRLSRLPGCYRGQDGPVVRKVQVARKRWVDEPLEFDAAGDPIWTPSARADEAPRNLWSGGKLQELLYLNPEPDMTPIRDRSTRQQIHETWLAGLRHEKTEVEP